MSIYLLTGAFVGMVFALAVITVEVQREHRQAATHRGDTGPGAGGTSAIARAAAITTGTGTFSTTTNVTGAIVPGPGPYATRPGDTIDTVAGVEPIRAWKHAIPVIGLDGRVMFKPLTGGRGTYGVEAVAICGNDKPHDAPDLLCSCGFYAHNHPVEPDRLMAALEVELYGKVIVCEWGYRAEKQRVLSITAMSECTGSMEYRQSDLVVTTMGTMDECCPYSARWQDRDGNALCSRHAVKGTRRFYPLELKPVICDTEWRWVT